MSVLFYTRVVDSPIDPDTKFGKNVRLGEGVVIDAGCKIGDNCFIGHNTVIRSGVTLGDDVIIGHLCVIEADTIVGDRTTIQCNCYITKNMVIEEDVFVGPGVITSNTNKIVHGRNIPLKITGSHIKRAARIGAGAVLMPGIEVGDNSQVGLGSVVTKDVPSYEVWFGTPAVFKRYVDQKELL